MCTRTAWLAAAINLVAMQNGTFAQPPDRTTSFVRRIPSQSIVEGAWSTVMREDGGITMRFHTLDLEPGAAYTIWWVVFNHPDFCSPDPANPAAGPSCGSDDLGNPMVQASRALAAGGVVGTNGRSNFKGSLQVGDATGFLDGPWGLTNPRGAEIHLVARTHGQPLPGLVDDQISTFNGGCPPYPAGTCVNRQISVHLP